MNDQVNNQFNQSPIAAHTHNGSDSLPVNFSSLTNRTRYVLYRILDPTTDTATGTSIGGDFVMPFGGYVTAVGATVDTAGTTNKTTVDVLKNGTSVLSTKITIDSGSKTSRDASVPSILGSVVSFDAGDIYTFNIDTVSATPAKGLTVFMNVVQTTP